MSADVVLLLEGTYPYIRGGVSSWVHQIILSQPERSFHLVFIGGDPSLYGDIRYELPDNVCQLDTYFINEQQPKKPLLARKTDPEQFELWCEFTEFFFSARSDVPSSKLVSQIFKLLNTKQGVDLCQFLYSKTSWQNIQARYQAQCPDQSFTDFFWTFRGMLAPLFRIAEIARQLPKAGVYHSISTGYAGFLGAGASLINDVPLLISEHGIYTKERKIDLASAQWVPSSKRDFWSGLSHDPGVFKAMWIRFFEVLGRCAYDQAQTITSLYQGNRERQLRDGAPAQKLRVVPNGISLERFSACLAQRPSETPMVMGLIGRVVSIKDIKHFIRSVRFVSASIPQIEGWIIGPCDEDPAYVEECEQLVESLGLVDQVKFLGMQDITQLLPKLGLIMLTSISEAQPLVLLEGMAAGVPFVATDVGSCREIAEGMDETDRAYGQAGSIVPIAAPNITADAVLALLNDPERWSRYQQAGLARVRNIYHDTLMFERFKELYEESC